jgi:hypothetical protein
MKRVLILFATCLFVFTLYGLAFAKKECKDPSNYQWDPKSGDCIEKTKEQKCEDTSKYRWDPTTGNCIEK